jgi:phospholipase/carboxylesterase
MTAQNLSFLHRFITAEQPIGATTLLLLHGTGGDENDLLPLGKALAPSAALLSPRGKVLENGMPRFFRRLALDVFDEKDLTFRTHELASFIRDAAASYNLDAEKIFAVGYSNGANIASSLLLLYPGLLKVAVLFHPMVPFVPEALPDLPAVPIFIGATRHDEIVPPEETERLATLLRNCRADVMVHWEPGGHGLSPGEVEAARRWLTRYL